MWLGRQNTLKFPALGQLNPPAKCSPESGWCSGKVFARKWLVLWQPSASPMHINVRDELARHGNVLLLASREESHTARAAWERAAACIKCVIFQLHISQCVNYPSQNVRYYLKS